MDEGEAHEAMVAFDGGALDRFVAVVCHADLPELENETLCSCWSGARVDRGEEGSREREDGRVGGREDGDGENDGRVANYGTASASALP